MLGRGPKRCRDFKLGFQVEQSRLRNIETMIRSIWLEEWFFDIPGGMQVAPVDISNGRHRCFWRHRPKYRAAGFCTRAKDQISLPLSRRSNPVKPTAVQLRAVAEWEMSNKDRGLGSFRGVIDLELGWRNNGECDFSALFSPK